MSVQTIGVLLVVLMVPQRAFGIYCCLTDVKPQTSFRLCAFAVFCGVTEFILFRISGDRVFVLSVIISVFVAVGALILGVTTRKIERKYHA